MNHHTKFLLQSGLWSSKFRIMSSRALSLILVICLIALYQPLDSVSAAGISVGSVRHDVEVSPSVSAVMEYAPTLAGDKIMVDWWDYNGSSHGPVLVGTDGTISHLPAVSISPTTNDNSDTVIYHQLSNGNTLVYWYSGSSGTGLTDTYFKIIDSGGTQVLGSTKINSAPGELNRFTTVAELSNGTLAFVWATSGSNYALRRFQQNGTAIDASQISITSLAGLSNSQYNHAISANSNGRFIIVINHYPASGQPWDRRGMVFENSSSTPVQVGGQNTFVIATSQGEMGINTVDTLSNNRFLVTYMKQTGSDTSTRNVAFRIYNDDGTPYASETLIQQIHSWGFINDPLVFDSGFAHMYWFHDLVNPACYLKYYDNNGAYVQDLSSSIPLLNGEYGQVFPFVDFDGSLAFAINDTQPSRLDYDIWLLRHGPANQPPSITGSGSVSLNDKATATPFSGLSFTDPENDGGTINITYTAANGTLSGNGLTGTAGNYTLSGADPTELTNRLQALVFTPTANQVAPGNTVQTNFTLTPNDGAQNGTAVTATANVTSVNDAPTNITLSFTSVNQSGGVNAVVGTLGTIDPDVGETHTYSLVAGEGDTHNSSFNISNNSLQANDAAAMAAGNYSVRVRTTDAGGLEFEKIFTITVVDNVPPVFDVAPAVSNLTLTGFSLSASLNESGTIFYVVVLDGAAAPSSAQITSGLNAGGMSAIAAGSQAVGMSPFSHSFVITGLNQSTAYSIYAVARDSANNTMAVPVRVDATTQANSVPVVTLPSSPSVHEDSVANSIAGISIADMDGDSQQVTLTAAHGTMNLSPTGLSSLAGNGTGSVCFEGSLAAINNALASLSFTPTADFHGPAVINISTLDGKGGNDAQGLTVTVHQGPRVLAVNRIGNERTNANSLEFYIGFSHVVSGVDATDFQVTGSTTATVSSVSFYEDTTYKVTVSGGDLATFNGSVGLSVVDDDSIVRLDTGTPLGGVGISGVGDGSFSAGDIYILDNTPPNVFAEAITIAGSTGTGGAFRVGDTVSVDWDPTGNDDVASVSVDFSQFGGSTAVPAAQSGGLWRATYIITAGNIDATERSAAVTATDIAGNVSAAVTSSYQVTVDNQPPAVNAAAISLSGANGYNGTFRIGDTVTATWNPIGNADIVDVIMDFSQFGGGATVNSMLVDGQWTATFTLTAGTIDSTGLTVGVTAIDDAGNTSTAPGGNATVDTKAPTISGSNISISGATGTGGIFIIGDVITVTWNNTSSGDHNADIASVVVDFSTIGADSAVVAHNGTGIWTATQAIANGDLNEAASLTITLRATDIAGNQTSMASATTLTVDNVRPGQVTGTLQVQEMAPNGTVVGTVNSLDAVSFALIDTAGGRFAINAASGQVTVANGSLLDFETESTHDITVRATDAAGNTTSTVLAVTLLDVNDPPILDLNGAEAGTNYSTIFNVGGSAVTIVAPDALLHDVDAGAYIVSMTVVIATTPDGNNELLNLSSQANLEASSAGLTLSYNTATHTLSATGAAAPSVYQEILRGILYSNTADFTSVTAGNRTLTVSVSDGIATTQATSTINVVSAPVVDLAVGPVTFTEEAGPVLVTPGATITDRDSTYLSQVVMTLANPLDGALEIISLDGYPSGSTFIGITITYTSNAVITLTGNATLPDYQTLVRALQYQNLSQGPETATQRVITVVARDIDGNTGPANSVQVSVVGVNDAPSLTVTAPSLGSTDEDTPAVCIVSSFLGPIADPDRNSLFGIAITGLTGNGVWQYSTDGGATWENVSTVSNSSSLLLRDTDQLRYEPDGANGETATMTYRAWDRTSGVAGTHVDTSTNGGTTAFSANTATGTLLVTDLNNAPTLTNEATFALVSTNEDTVSTPTMVSSILAGVGYADADTGAVSGIAINGTSGLGVWQYSIDGVTWTDLPAVSASNALLLRSTDQIRYVPNGERGENASLSFHAWDQTSGTAGSAADVTTTGGRTSFSSNWARAVISVDDVNDAPVLTDTSINLPITDLDTMRVVTVGSFLQSTDVDPYAQKGIAVIGISGAGEWHYSTDAGTTWSSLAGVSELDARLLSDTDLVRYTPNGTTAETASMNYRAWDQTSGTIGNTANTTVNGGSTAFSADSGTASIKVAFAVTYDGNLSTSGTVPTDDNVYEEGDTVTVLGNTGNLARSGHTFAGWNTEANGQGTSYAPTETFTMGTAKVTLYAEWTPNPTYTVSYNGNGNTSGNAPTGSSYEQGAAVTVLGNTGNLARSGHTFAGWNTEANGQGTSYAPGQTFSMGTANVTLYARWQVVEYYEEPAPSTPPAPPAPVLPPTPPAEEPQGPHTVITISPEGVITETNLDSIQEVLADGRVQENITIPTGLAETILTDKAAGSNTVGIVLKPQDNEENGTEQAVTTAPVVAVTIPTEVLAAATDMTLNLTTMHGTLTLPPQLINTLAAQEQNLTVTIDRQPVESLSGLLPAGTEPIGAALSVQTELKGPTMVSIAVNAQLPENTELRQAFLDELMTFAIHSSGSREMIFDVNRDVLETVYTDEHGVERTRYTLRSVSFWVNEFSRFVVVKPNWNHLETIVGTPGFSIAGVQRDMVACYYKGSDTYMPIRMLEEFGVNFNWDDASQTATMTYKEKTAVLTIGSTYAYINGVRTPIIGASGALLAPELAPGRTMIPLRFVSEHLGFTVTWDPSNLITIRLN